ncbi:MAG: hypothetical protein ACRCYU_02295 [Nocardioides sp.]
MRLRMPLPGVLAVAAALLVGPTAPVVSVLSSARPNVLRLPRLEVQPFPD